MTTVSRRDLLKGSAIAVGATLVGISPLLNKGRVLAQEFSSDIDVLNYALTLEHLEYAFYRDGLNRFTRNQIGNMPVLGLPQNKVYDYFEAIRDHEKAHVDTLTSVISSLGGTPVAECVYNFGYNDALGFLAVATALENTGVMAYDGAVADIQNPDLQTAAATIATVEARHAAFLNLLSGVSPFPAAFDTPKSRAEILAIAGPFIVSCP